MNKLFRYGLLIIIVWGGLSPGIAHAYVDPGTAGFVITTILGLLAAIAYTARSFLYRLQRLIFRRGRKVSDVDAEAPR